MRARMVLGEQIDLARGQIIRRLIRESRHDSICHFLCQIQERFLMRQFIRRHQPTNDPNHCLKKGDFPVGPRLSLPMMHHTSHSVLEQLSVSHDPHCIQGIYGRESHPLCMAGDPRRVATTRDRQQFISRKCMLHVPILKSVYECLPDFLLSSGGFIASNDPRCCLCIVLIDLFSQLVLVLQSLHFLHKNRRNIQRRMLICLQFIMPLP
mmetsp:Transcript_5602/g.21080  ORF Transcript_5602/g.21080 Transcript_5602/m.21080 type:complete len:209 (-) Transcript_5602:171-797(-)